MAFSIFGPIFPQPALASGGTSYLTSQVTSVTTGATTVTGFTPINVQVVTFDVAGDDVRCYWEGSTPTSSTGHVLPGSTQYTWPTNQYNNAKFILSGSGTAATITASPFSAG